MIPKKIHYCWFGGKTLPRDVVRCINSWKKHAPDYEIIQWNESNIDIDKYPFMKSAYENKAWAFVSDFARLLVVYENGGVYLDTDVELLKAIDPLLKYRFFMGKQQGGHPTTGLGYGAEKNNDVVLNMIRMYDNIIFSEHEKNKITCPLMNSKVIYDLGYTDSETIWEKDGIAIFPSKYFDPIAQGNTQNLLCADSYSIHHYAGSWTSKSNRAKRKLVSVIGDEKIYLIKKLLGKAK